MIRNHRDLKVWEAGMDLCVGVYQATEGFPKSEVFGLVSQMRRAASSVPANIAEGFSRQHKPGFIQFLHIAQGSLSELDTYLRLSQRLGYMTEQTVESLSEQMVAIVKMLHSLIARLRQHQH